MITTKIDNISTSTAAKDQSSRPRSAARNCSSSRVCFSDSQQSNASQPNQKWIKNWATSAVTETMRQNGQDSRANYTRGNNYRPRGNFRGRNSRPREAFRQPVSGYSTNNNPNNSWRGRRDHQRSISVGHRLNY